MEHKKGYFKNPYSGIEKCPTDEDGCKAYLPLQKEAQSECMEGCFPILLTNDPEKENHALQTVYIVGASLLLTVFLMIFLILASRRWRARSQQDEENNVHHGNVQHTDDHVGNVQHTDDHVGNVQHTDDHVGDVQHTDDHVGNVQHTDDHVGNVQHTDDHVGNVQQTDDHVGDVQHTDDHLGNVPRDLNKGVNDGDEIFRVQR